MNDERSNLRKEKHDMFLKRIISLIAKPIPKDLKDEEGGWTFVETLIVIAIIIILTGSVGFAAFRYIDKAKISTTKSQIESLGLALNAYYIDCKRYPSEEQGLVALWEKPILEPVPAGWDGPYIEKALPDDPWGNPYEYTVPGPHGLPWGIRSLGADGTEGGEGKEGDITSWEN